MSGSVPLSENATSVFSQVTQGNRPVKNAEVTATIEGVGGGADPGSVQQSSLSSQFVFHCCNVQNGLKTHLSPYLHFNLQIKMPKRKLRSEMGLLNTLQFTFALWDNGAGADLIANDGVYSRFFFTTDDDDSDDTFYTVSCHARSVEGEIGGAEILEGLVNQGGNSMVWPISSPFYQNNSKNCCFQ